MLNYSKNALRSYSENLSRENLICGTYAHCKKKTSYFDISDKCNTPVCSVGELYLCDTSLWSYEYQSTQKIAMLISEVNQSPVNTPKGYLLILWSGSTVYKAPLLHSQILHLGKVDILISFPDPSNVSWLTEFTSGAENLQDNFNSQQWNPSLF